MNLRPWTRVIVWIAFFGFGYMIGTSSLIDRERSPDINAEPDITPVTNVAFKDDPVHGDAIPRKLNDEESATISLFEAAAPSVAFINTATFRQDYWTRDITEIPRGSGSGFVWDKEGHIVTNFHVIEDADKATVTLSDQSTWDADLVGYAPEKDLAILKIQAPKRTLVPIPVGISEDLLVGQSVYAIGNPFGLDQTLTTGIISALGREIKSKTGSPIRDVIQTDAAINPGNSGGPLLDSQGKLIGVNTAIFSPSGAYAGIGFSIPVDQVSWIVPDLIRYGKIRRPTIGVSLFTQNTVSRAGIQGAVVYEVVAGSAAERAGIQPTRRTNRGEIIVGDIIVGVGDQEVKTNADLQLALEEFRAGEEIDIRVKRGKKTELLKLRLDPAR